jgi:Family of unknown function (DUF5677)
VIAVSGYLIIAGFWLIPVVALTGYFLTRRGLRHTRSLIWFDIAVIAVGLIPLGGILWQMSADPDLVSHEERLVGYYTLPLTISFIFVPLLLIGAVFRYCAFSKPPAQGSHTLLPAAHSERLATELLIETESVISKALNALGNQKTKRIEDMYYFYAAKHIHDCVDAFIALRDQHRLDGARLIVRPALEMILKLRAVRLKPELLYRALIADSKEMDKWFSSVARRHDVAYTPITARQEWADFKARCIAQFGVEKLNDETPLKAFDAAKEIGVEEFYDTHYRGFGHYIHGLLEAISGALDELIDPESSRVMLQTAVTALDALNHLGADIRNLDSLNRRAVEILSKKPDKLRRQKNV